MEVVPGVPMLGEHDSVAPLYNFINVLCTGTGFVRHQIRRMLGAMVAVGCGRLTLDQVRYMLEQPDPQNWHSKAVCMAPSGLYLKQIYYDEKDFENPSPIVSSHPYKNFDVGIIRTQNATSEIS
ncbi:PREDICTED: tRNA pseudouridine synthase A-like [Priapulus caudatus]|uniref:tRNA pseudouridine synthase n=1 Tax=Priapulus caudatus TaxID=37621 RepID=A0ABM1DSL2_PRICU|nr:PREDICTED: tRNA pseudouridine synthase A-like [Priapulus caudatus]